MSPSLAPPFICSLLKKVKCAKKIALTVLSPTLFVPEHFYIFFWVILSLCSVLERLDELEYRRVELHGVFDHSRELYVWPRTLISDDVIREGGRGRAGREGPATRGFCHHTFPLPGDEVRKSIARCLH